MNVQGIETLGGIMTNISILGSCWWPNSASRSRSTRGERELVKDNNKLLGNFNLVDIPPAPKGVPQIEITFHYQCGWCCRRFWLTWILTSFLSAMNEFKDQLDAAEKNKVTKVARRASWTHKSGDASGTADINSGKDQRNMNRITWSLPKGLREACCWGILRPRDQDYIRFLFSSCSHKYAHAPLRRGLIIELSPTSVRAWDASQCIRRASELFRRIKST